MLPVRAAYSQGLKLGPFVLTNVMTRKLFLAQKSSLGGLIFALLSPVGEWTRARAHAPPLLSAPRPPRPPDAGPCKRGMALAGGQLLGQEDGDVFERLMG